MRLVRVACAALPILAFSILPSLAQDQTPPNPLMPLSNALSKIANLPDGWTRNMDGSYRQADSGVLCPMQFKTFALDDVQGPSTDNPNIVGQCRYRDGNGRTGSIRIRKYVEGWGSDESLAANDKQLMGADAPPMLMRASVDHKTAASRLTVTTTRHGYLIDCSVAQIEHSIPKGDFPLYCTTIPQ
ncbi:MAG TPA: hypothetical protein VGH02_11795 [Rhizomicrobium sp.]